MVCMSRDGAACRHVQIHLMPAVVVASFPVVMIDVSAGALRMVWCVWFNGSNNAECSWTLFL